MDYEVKGEAELASNPEVQSKNGLLYVMPQSLSSSVNKTFIRQQSQRQSYSEGETMVFDMNTGSRYVDPENCMLMFDIATDGAAQSEGVYTPFKSDVGAVSLIEELHVHAKSGVELERIQECNQYSYTRAKLRENTDYWTKWASMWGGGLYSDGSAKAQAQCGSTAKRVVIPMKVISGLFSPTVKGMKMPPGLLSGSRIEITLEEFGRAFGAGLLGHAATTYTVTNPIIVCLAHELGDNSQDVLNEESIETGLEYTYTRVFTTVEPTSSTSVNIQVKKAVAQGLRAFAVPVLATTVASQASSASFTSNLNYTRYQFRVGSAFYPQQRVDTHAEGFWTTMNLYNKSACSSWFSSTLSFDEYDNDALDVGPNLIMGAGFEQDQRLNLTGVPINNSATMTLEATTVTPSGIYNWFVFLEYVAVAKCYLTNVELKI